MYKASCQAVARVSCHIWSNEHTVIKHFLGILCVGVEAGTGNTALLPTLSLWSDWGWGREEEADNIRSEQVMYHKEMQKQSRVQG